MLPLLNIIGNPAFHGSTEEISEVEFTNWVAIYSSWENNQSKCSLPVLHGMFCNVAERHAKFLILRSSAVTHPDRTGFSSQRVCEDNNI